MLSNETSVRSMADTALAERAKNLEAIVGSLSSTGANILAPAAPKPSKLSKVAKAVGSVLRNPLVQSALTALVMKKLNKR